ncbi:hypothetical protein DL89DRAFT_294688 [Linderina pennispora]|uniref:Autophagy-related protein 29 n=1 Tax=Linderina pennispora TaxID=61395 RepID=A0A1Y1W1Y1_9FUNG|nr:uncharacterized protein DL89DRAFT_294688 [Linderina pennispora]ORX67531.1 hypothetical protein DL89DRAFT_294688 [Linderina pennispora]
MDTGSADRPVNIIFRFPFKRPEAFPQPTLVAPAPTPLDEQVWRYLLTAPQGRPLEILAEIEEDEVTFDWGLLAHDLNVPLHKVLAAAAMLFERHTGRSLKLEDSEVQMSARAAAEQASRSPGTPDAPEEPLADAGLRSVESLGTRTPSPAVGLSTRTPEEDRSIGQPEDHSMKTAPAASVRMRSVGGPADPNVAEVQLAEEPSEEKASSLGSFSDLSDSSITESALQDALISEALNASTGMSSMLRSRMFPWSKKK